MQEHQSALIRVMDIAFEPSLVAPGVIVRFKGIPLHFAPNVLDGMSVKLSLVCSSEPIVGTLHVIPKDAARGLWITYHFVPESPELVSLVRFEGINHYSSIASLKIEHRGQRYTFMNPFCRP